MEGFDIDVFGTIRRWPRWKQRVVLVAGIALLSWGIWMFVWITFLANNPAGVLGN